MQILVPLKKYMKMSKRSIPELPENIARKLKLIGLKVKERRKSIEKNYQIFADKNGLNYMTLWRIENGENYNMSSLLEILDTMGVSPEEFFKDIK